MNDGLSAVLSRISQIESLISRTGGGVPALASTATSTTTSTRGSDFQDALGRATGTTGTGGAGGPGGALSAALGEQAVAIARKYLGVPYVWGGSDPDTGLDCSGFTQLVYRQLGVELPRVSRDQAGAGSAVGSLSQARPGDLVFFGSPVHHVGIYVGDGKMIDAPHRGEKVQIRDVYQTPSQIRRVLPDGSGALATASQGAAGWSGSGLFSANLTGASQSSSTIGALLTGGSGRGLSGTPYAALFTATGQRYGVDPALLSAVARAESGYQADAVSPAGAQGLMQLMPGTAQSLGVDPNDPAQAADGAARLLSDSLRSFNGRVDLALAAFNAGPGAVRKYNGVPPYPETQNYVQRVQRYWGELR